MTRSMRFTTVPSPCKCSQSTQYMNECQRRDVSPQITPPGKGCKEAPVISPLCHCPYSPLITATSILSIKDDKSLMTYSGQVQVLLWWVKKGQSPKAKEYSNGVPPAPSHSHSSKEKKWNKGLFSFCASQHPISLAVRLGSEHCVHNSTPALTHWHGGRLYLQNIAHHSFLWSFL